MIKNKKLVVSVLAIIMLITTLILPSVAAIPEADEELVPMANNCCSNVKLEHYLLEHNDDYMSTHGYCTAIIRNYCANCGYYYDSEATSIGGHGMACSLPWWPY